MDIPFELRFFYFNTTSWKHEDNIYTSFSLNYKEASQNVEKYMLTVTELHDLRVKFEYTDNNDAYFWIETMDMMPEQCFTPNENHYFCSSTEIRPLYLNYSSNFNKAKISYPEMLPGIYRLHVKIKNQYYYSFLEVKPSRLDDKQLELMKEEVENTLLGLSKELKPYTADKKSLHSVNSNDVISKYDCLIKNYKSLTYSINELSKKPKYEVKKYYTLKQSGKPLKCDLETIKFHQIRRDIANKSKGYNYVLNYDTQLNQTLKFILMSIREDTLRVIKYLEILLETLKIELNEKKKFKQSLIETYTKIKNAEDNKRNILNLQEQIMLTLHIEFFKNVTPSLKGVSQISRTSVYNQIYRVYLELKNYENIKVNPLENYSYYWKETYKLYEIWGFIKLIDIIKNSQFNFTKISGWIFESSNDILPFLNPGEKIQFENEENLKLVVYYDKEITKAWESTSIDEPVYTIESHNRPDFRMDIYYEGLYKGSIIADFKYRGLKKLGSEKIYTQNQYSNQGYEVFKQLVHYSYVRSFYVNRTSKAKSNVSSIKEVLGIFPLRENDRPIIQIDHGANITRIALSPGISTEDLSKELLSIIEEAIE